MLLFLTNHFLPLPLHSTLNCHWKSYRPHASCYRNSGLIDGGLKFTHIVPTDTYTYRYIILSDNYGLPLPLGSLIVVTLSTYLIG